jgi:putative tricarboxylic transport membrane protein
VLGDKAEDAFRQSMLISQGEVSVMFSNYLVGGITTLALVLLFWPLISKVLDKIRPPKKDEFEADRPVD